MILVTQNEDKYEIRFPYDAELVQLVKNVPGRVWNPEQKFWSVPLARLGFFLAQVKGTKYEKDVTVQSHEDININASINEPNQIPDIDISDVTMYVQDGQRLFNHQKDMLRFAKWRYENGLKSGFILADEMGCIAGNQFVRIRENNNGWTREATLSSLYHRFKAGNQIKIRTLEQGRFVYKPVANVIDKGVKHVIKLKTNSHQLTCTPDHEILTPSGWVSADQLSVGDKILMNGKIKFCDNRAIFTNDDGDEFEPICPRCNSTENIVRARGSKYLGYCRSCMYKLRSGGRFKDTDLKIYKHIDSDGYVKLQGYPIRFSPVYERYNNGEGIYEHHQVWYEHTGHVVDTATEAIHHKNHIRTDNRIENLELLKLQDHYRAHLTESLANLPQNHLDAQYYYAHGKKVMLVPMEEEVVDIIDDDEVAHVYDVTIDDPVVHNFVCNHFIVHNCGKTLQVMNWAMYLKEHYGIKHCLIIACVNSAKYNWREDIIKHTNGKEIPYILGSRLKRNGEINLTGGSAEKLEDLTTMKQYGEKGIEPLPYFLILNIEAVRMRVKKKFPIAERLVELINNKEIGMIALDEIHRNCLTHDALIQTDCGLMQLGDIVENKLNVNVLSYDITTDSIVYKPVTNWHSVQVTSQLIEIVVEENQNLRVIRCTPDHEFYTRNRGWIAASDLTGSDDIILADKEEFDDN